MNIIMVAPHTPDTRGVTCVFVAKRHQVWVLLHPVEESHGSSRPLGKPITVKSMDVKGSDCLDCLDA